MGANLAIEALKKLINGDVRSQSKRNVTQSRAFSERLEAAISRYHANALTTAQVSSAPGSNWDRSGACPGAGGEDCGDDRGVNLNAVLISCRRAGGAFFWRLRALCNQPSAEMDRW